MNAILSDVREGVSDLRVTDGDELISREDRTSGGALYLGDDWGVGWVLSRANVVALRDELTGWLAPSQERVRRQLDRELREGAVGHVDSDGRTTLPQHLLVDLGLERGGDLWFLRPTPVRQWEAWTAEQLDRAFGWSTAQASKGGA
ncbi:hypothetical protein [Chondromyces apiculatus]|uniref:SpoVT-AbrB domain-containing protein n=1 Tax=Chondromyces apiculatus DSM 436 TaxID=1192034 RepID=A0A017SYM1_9BACT|nr:hypothetical protein [Chondromyces apiculatus]EYF01882.1 Hypothetical protein CAP_7650 [Chondromyces apiculatus DSM 436]